MAHLGDLKGVELVVNSVDSLVVEMEVELVVSSVEDLVAYLPQPVLRPHHLLSEVVTEVEYLQ